MARPSDLALRAQGSMGLRTRGEHAWKRRAEAFSVLSSLALGITEHPFRHMPFFTQRPRFTRRDLDPGWYRKNVKKILKVFESQYTGSSETGRINTT